MKHKHSTLFIIGVCCFLILPAVSLAAFSRTLKIGMSGADVLQLQKILNQDERTRIAVSGPGSQGNETTYFGKATQAAVNAYQTLNATEILHPSNLTAPTGIVGPNMRAHLNAKTGETGLADINFDPETAVFQEMQVPTQEELDSYRAELNKKAADLSDKYTILGAELKIKSLTYDIEAQKMKGDLEYMRQMDTKLKSILSQIDALFTEEGDLIPGKSFSTHLEARAIAPIFLVPETKTTVYGSGFSQTSVILLGDVKITPITVGVGGMSLDFIPPAHLKNPEYVLRVQQGEFLSNALPVRYSAVSNPR